MKKAILLSLVLVLPLLASAQSGTKQQGSEAAYGQTSVDNATLLARAEADAIAKKYGGAAAAQKELYTLLMTYQSDVQKAFATYTGPRLKQELEGIALRTDSLKQQLLLSQTGGGVAESHFSIALKNQRSLKLSKAQVDTLTSKALRLQRIQRNYQQKNPGMVYDTKAAEADMPKILSDDQYFQFLLIRNRPQARSWSVGDWQELRQRGMTTGLDSAKTVQSIFLYDMNRLAIKERYANDPVKQKIAVTDIDKVMPNILKQLKSARAHGNPTGENAMKSSFTW